MFFGARLAIINISKRPNSFSIRFYFFFLYLPSKYFSLFNANVLNQVKQHLKVKKIIRLFDFINLRKVKRVLTDFVLAIAKNYAINNKFNKFILENENEYNNWVIIEI